MDPGEKSLIGRKKKNQWVEKTMLVVVAEDSDDLRSKLTFYPIGVVKQNAVSAYKKMGTGLMIPQFTDHEKRAVSTCMPCSKFCGVLRPHQVQAAHAVYSDLENYGCALAYLYTGWGKTAMGLYVASCFDCRVVVYVHKISLEAQWLDAVKKFVPYKEVEVRTVQKQLRHLEELRDFDESVFIIFDECHHYAAHSFSKLLVHSRAGYHLALSASEHRADGLETMLHLYFGRPSTVDTMLRVVPEVKLVRYHGPEELYVTSTMNVKGQVIPNVNELLNKLAECEERNRILVDTISRLEGRCVLVLTKRRCHAVMLTSLCREKLACEVRLLLGGMSADKISEAKSDSESVVLIATTQSAGEGFDMPCLDTLVIALPCSSVQQEVGRILRRCGTKQALVIDVVDSSPITYAQFNKRKKFYASQNMTISNF